MSKQDALKRISEITKQVAELMKEATELADKEAIAFSISLHGARGTYWGKGIKPCPKKKDFATDAEYNEAMDKWEKDNSDYGSHPWGGHGWANSTLNC